MSKILTISVAAYNIEPYINELMDSIIKANCMDDLEILIINDGSKDQTSSLAHEYEKTYPNSVKLVEKENGGHGSTINKGIELATGKYFRALDGDDWVNSENLRELIITLKKTDVDLVICDYNKCYSDGSVETLRFSNIKPMEKHMFFEALQHITWMCYHTLIYRTSILKNNSIRLDEKCFYVDTEYDLFPIPYISTLLYFNKPVYCYRLGVEGQSVSYESRKKNIQHSLIVANSLLHMYVKQANRLSEIQKNYVLFGIADHCIWHIQSIFLFNCSSLQKEKIKSFDNMIKSVSQEVYNKMTELGKDSRIVKLLRRTNYYSYWIIKMYKAIR